MAWRTAAVFFGLVLLASALRLPALAARPMHADEAIHADKLGALLEGGGYAYDPTEYHGPTLYYMALLPAWLQGARRYVEIDEVTLRSVPAVLGVLLVAAHLAARPLLGAPAATLAALLAAISPAMVFYSRYFIHEVPLVFFSFLTLLGTCFYLRRPGPVAALLTGASAGLMLATKETALLALGSLLLAVALTNLADRRREVDAGTLVSVVRGRDLLLALGAALVVAVLLFSSFLRHPAGVADALRAYANYAGRATAASAHFHPWDFYLRLLLHFPSQGTPVWSEGLILALASVGGLAAWVGKGVPGADQRWLRLLGLYALLLLVVYSAVPYKTPWCLLGFLHGLILLAGAGATILWRAAPGRAGRALVAAVLVAGAVHLGWQAVAGSFRFASDPRNPYVYAHTGTDVFEIAGRIRAAARAHPDGVSVPVQIVSRENLWPLPWYLRGLTGVQWWNAVSDEARVAPVVVVTPDMEASLVRRLYDLPPPGERELYVSLFDRPLELRPRVELRAYVARSLSEDMQRLEGASR